MSEEYRGHAGDGEGGILAIVLVVLLLLLAVGGGFYFVTGQRNAARQAEMRALEAERAAQEAAAALRRGKGP